MNLHRQGNSTSPLVAHPVEDQDTSSDMTACKCHTVTGLHPLHIPRSNPDVHPTMDYLVIHHFTTLFNIMVTKKKHYSNG